MMRARGKTMAPKEHKLPVHFHWPSDTIQSARTYSCTRSLRDEYLKRLLLYAIRRVLFVK